MKDMFINESTFTLENGKVGKLAVFIYTGDGNPHDNLDYAVKQYVGDSDTPYNVFIDAQMNCPWMVTLISNINDMKQGPYNGETLTQFLRDDKLKQLGI